MLDIICTLFKVGDYIKLTLTDGMLLSGEIMALNSSTIVVRSKDNHVKGVSETLILSFEQLAETKKEDSQLRVEKRKDVKIIDKIPIDQLLQKDPKLKRRFPNLAKEQGHQKAQSLKQESIANDLSVLMERVDSYIRTAKIDEAISFIDGLSEVEDLAYKTKSALLLKKAQILSAQHRQKESAKAYQELINLNVKNDAGGNNISHLYTELARLQMLNADMYGDAYTSIMMALKYNKDNASARNLVARLETMKSSMEIIPTASDFIIDVTESQFVPSAMILADVNNHKYTSPLIINCQNITESIANETYEEAEKLKTENKVKSYLMFLEAAKAYSELPIGSYEYQNYLMAMANYSLLKGDSLFTKYKTTADNSKDTVELCGLKDSACSYYRESLGLMPDDNPDALLKIVTNYLKLEVGQYLVDNGQRPLFTGSFKDVFKDCVNGGRFDLKKAAIRMVLSCGSASIKVWNTLCQGVALGSLLTNKDVRNDVFDAINEIGGFDISKTIQPKEFFKKAFRLWKDKEQDFISFVSVLDFDIREMSSISKKWESIDAFSSLLLPTDMENKHFIDNILRILNPYLSRNQVERANLLIRTQRLIDSQLKYINKFNTYFGVSFFLPLLTKWKEEIDELISDKIAKSYPQIEINFDPPFFVYDGDERFVNLTLQNVGETTAEGVSMSVKIESDKIDVSKMPDIINISINEEVPAGAQIGYYLQIPNNVYPKAKVLYLSIKVAPYYLNKKLEESEYSSTIEEEPISQLTYDDILWKDGPIPEHNLFKGRKVDIKNLAQHYLSVERDKPYILYGLTRTGKSSILKFLKEDIEGNIFKKDGIEMMVLPIMWDLSIAAGFGSSSDFWDYVTNAIIASLKPYSYRYNVDISDMDEPKCITAKDLPIILRYLNSKNIYPLFLVDEFSFVKTLIDNNIVNTAFLHTLRQYSLEGLASFLFAGTYDIKELIKDPKYGITGQLVNAISKQVAEIKPKDAEELMNVMEDHLKFTKEAISHIHKLSGDIPYFIQIICKNCGYYASDFKRSVIGYPEVEKVISILTGEEKPYASTLLTTLTENTFQNNQFSPLDPPEVGALISSIVFYNQNNKLIPRGVSSEEVEQLWEEYGILDRKKLSNAFQVLTEKRVLVRSNDDGHPVYSFSVDLFRRWWTVAHPDFNLEITELKL